MRLGVVGFWGSPTHGEAFEPLADFLAERIGRPVEVMSAERYDDLVDLLSEGLLDLALLPPLVYVRASSKALPPKLIRTMVVNGSIHYSGYVIVRADSPVSRPADLVARRVAFVESSSASGYVFARKWLTSHGLGPESLDATVFAGSHEAVIRAVISGEVDAGATFQGALRSARAVGLDTGVLRVLAITGRIPLDALVAASDLDSDLVAEIDAALGRANTNTAEGRTALSKLPGINGWVRTDDSLYRPLRKVLASSAGEPGGDR